jgi:hypothetical protein
MFLSLLVYRSARHAALRQHPAFATGAGSAGVGVVAQPQPLSPCALASASLAQQASACTGTGPPQQSAEAAVADPTGLSNSIKIEIGSHRREAGAR